MTVEPGRLDPIAEKPEVDEIDGIEPLRKRIIDRREQVARLGRSAATGQQPRLDDARPQPEKPRILAPGYFDGAIESAELSMIPKTTVDPSWRTHSWLSV